MLGERNKRDAFLAMLEQGKTMLHLDARADGVDVPEQFREDPHLRLNFSYRFQLTTFEIGDQDVQASLSFQGEPYLCVIPWTAVFGMTSHVTNQFEAWPEDMPPELLEQAAAMAAAEKGLDEEEDLDDPAVVGGAIRKHPHLRLIK